EAAEPALRVARQQGLRAVVEQLDLGRLTPLAQGAREVGRDDQRRAHRPAAQAAVDGVARGEGDRDEPLAGGDVLHQPAALGRAVGVEHRQAEPVHLGGEREAERQQGDERHRDQDRHREGVAEGGTDLAADERQEPARAHPGCSTVASTWRKTSVIGVSLMRTAAPPTVRAMSPSRSSAGWSRTRRARVTPSGVSVAAAPSAPSRSRTWPRAAGGAVTSIRKASDRRPRSSAGEASAISRPASMSDTRSQYSTSSKKCVVTKTVTPATASSWIASQKRPRLRTSTPAVGSSRKRTRGECSMLSARPARWRIAAGRFSGRSLSASASSKRSRSSPQRRSKGSPSSPNSPA